MMKVFSASQIKDLDQYTIEHEPISSIELMERASRSFVDWFTEQFRDHNQVGIVCGTGNNGGDGLVIARVLKEWGYPVTVWVVRGGVPASIDFQVNYDRLATAGLVANEITAISDSKLFADVDILIDALFGSGLSRRLEGVYADAVNHINNLNKTVVSVDMPSGLAADVPSTGPIVKATFTVTFQSPKLSFFLPQSHAFTGEWFTRDIGLHKEAIKNTPATHFMATRKGIRKLLQKRQRFDHKGTFGHALLIAGAYGKMGAAVLASRAALRSGVGLLTVYTPSSGYTIMQTSVPEAMVITDPSESHLTEPIDSKKFDVVGIGPGIGQEEATVRMFRLFLEGIGKPLVIDADALNMLSSNRELMHLIPPGSILTPHPKEFQRLAGESVNDFDRLKKQLDLAARLSSVVIVKGAYSTIATPAGHLYFNSTGNPGLATGGTGDVLTGIITGLLAQGYVPEIAALLGVYLHGLSGDLAVLEKGMESLIASDVIDFVPQAFRKIAV